MRRWLLPVLSGVVMIVVAYQAALIAAPRILMAAAIKRVAQGGVNRFSHAALATDKAQIVVRPSPDLAYSSCPFDLSRGPVAIHVAPAPAAYWARAVFDARPTVAYVRNNRDTAGRPIDVVLARDGQTAPAGAQVVRIDGAKGIALVRILVEDRAVFASIDAARKKSTCGPI